MQNENKAHRNDSLKHSDSDSDVLSPRSDRIAVLPFQPKHRHQKHHTCHRDTATATATASLARHSLLDGVAALVVVAEAAALSSAALLPMGASRTKASLLAKHV